MIGTRGKNVHKDAQPMELAGRQLELLGSVYPRMLLATTLTSKKKLVVAKLVLMMQQILKFPSEQSFPGFLNRIPVLIRQ